MNSIAASDHGVSRVDELTVTPASASVPSAPRTLQAATTGATTVSLSWAAGTSGNPSSYTIYRGAKSGDEALVPIATVSGTTTAYADSGLHSGSTYFYNVAANNSVGISPDSNELIVTPAGVVTVPAAPTGLVATAGDAAVTLGWSGTSGATGYSIYRSTTAGGEGATAIATTSTTGFTDTGRVNGTTYYYQLTALVGTNESVRTKEFPATAQ